MPASASHSDASLVTGQGPSATRSASWSAAATCSILESWKERTIKAISAKPSRSSPLIDIATSPSDGARARFSLTHVTTRPLSGCLPGPGQRDRVPWV
jgi:hypothetical protein